MPAEWLEFHWRIFEVVERLKVGVEAGLEASLVFHCYLAEIAVWQPLQQVDFAIGFENWLPKPSIAQITEIR